MTIEIFTMAYVLVNFGTHIPLLEIMLKEDDNLDVSIDA